MGRNQVRCPEAFADDHALLVWQRDTRRLYDLPLGPGHLVQAHTGGEIREVVSIISAGEHLEALAVAYARSQHTERTSNDW
jgi:hypothetical protein